MIPLLPIEKQLTIFEDVWDIIRASEMNVIFHRQKARAMSQRSKMIDVMAGLLAAVAGIGILSGIKSIPDSTWAIIAFCSGLVGQLRSVFGLPDLELQHRKLQNDYGSILSSLKSLVDRAKDADGLTYELDVQRQLTMERFHFVMERDETDYDANDSDTIQNKVNKMYPADDLWMPSSLPAQEEIQ